jgi:hypothetical protein
MIVQRFRNVRLVQEFSVDPELVAGLDQDSGAFDQIVCDNGTIISEDFADIDDENLDWIVMDDDGWEDYPQDAAALATVSDALAKNAPPF